MNTENEIWEGCIKLVTKSGYPISMIEDEGFKQILNIIKVVPEKQFNAVNLMIVQKK